jgi:flagellar hook assembly protein FlgD
MATAVEEELSVPESFLLMENYPNPFNSETMLRFSLSTRADVDLSIFNLAGQKIMTLIKDMREAGTYTMHWIGRDDSGREMSSGIYICRLRTGQQVAIQKLVLIK